jgi:selenocysteine lyase/cysteine desulfurase
MKRRQFLKSLGGVVGGLYFARAAGAHVSASAFKRACSGLQDDESFWRLVRQQFLFPSDYYYFNTGGLGASPLMVINTVREAMEREDTYPDAGHSHEEWQRVKEKCAPLLGPGNKPKEIALTSTATEGINIVVHGLPLRQGDEVITSTHEHVALNIPLLYRMQNEGIVIKTFEPDLKRGLGNVERIESLITARTRLIFISHVTCTTGQVFPVEEIGALAKAKGAWFALDGAQALAQIPVDLKGMGADFYALSGHKWLLGPKRTGILYVREELLDTLRPSIVGAYSDKTNSMPERVLELHPTAQRYEYGTQNDALFYGLGTAADFIATIGVDAICERNTRMAERFYQGLLEFPSIEILSPEEQMYRSSMITFRFRDRENDKACGDLTAKRLRVRGVGEANLDGIRVSFHVHNNEGEVDLLLDELRKIVNFSSSK